MRKNISVCAAAGTNHLTGLYRERKILLHNSLFKFAVSFFNGKNYKRPLRMDEHPLAFLLMLCDELQCWDRTAYGRNSRTELHPMAADFDFKNNAIHAIYYFDKDEQEKSTLSRSGTANGKTTAKWAKRPA